MTREEIIERAAQAFSRDAHDGPDAWDRLAEDERKSFRDGAQAALAAVGYFKLREAAEWGLAHAEGRTRCDDEQLSNCIEKAREALGDHREPQQEEWTSEVVPNRHGGGWIVRVCLNGKLDHERAFESMDAASEYAKAQEGDQTNE